MSLIKKLILVLILITPLASSAFAMSGKDMALYPFTATGKVLKATGKGVYKTFEYILVELGRPIRPFTNKLIDWFGVEYQE